MRTLRPRRSQAAQTSSIRSNYLFFEYPELSGRRVAMGDVAFRPFNLDPTERWFVAALAQVRSPKRIFEFGTYDGMTALLLAKEAPGTQVVTIDLPPDRVASEGGLVHEQMSAAGGVGRAFEGAPERTRITQLFGDTQTYDFGEYSGAFDLILIDASHEYDLVAVDSANALGMLAPGGTIVWDDYTPGFPGVIRAVDELAASRSLDIVHLDTTGLAVYDSSRSTA